MGTCVVCVFWSFWAFGRVEPFGRLVVSCILGSLNSWSLWVLEHSGRWVFWGRLGSVLGVWCFTTLALCVLGVWGLMGALSSWVFWPLGRFGHLGFLGV